MIRRTLVFAGLLAPLVAAAGLRVAGLRCEYAVDPAGIDVAAPRLSWRVESGERGQRQTAWQVQVASSLSVLVSDAPDRWDSGRVESDETVHLRYAGTPLASSERVFWRVRAWDRDGRSSAWSEPATWTMGLLDPAEWRGRWIVGPASTEALLLRQEFEVRPGLRRAVVHVAGLGQFELGLNGAKVGENVLSPGWTNYDRTILYETHDVTAALRPGRNAIGITLGNGMYHVVRRHRFAKFNGSFGPLKAMLHLRLEYGDGAVEFVGTDETWRTHPGGITYNSIYGGEDFDARLHPAGWLEPGFDDRTWRRAVVLVRPGGVLRGHSASSEPLRFVERRAPVAAWELAPGTIIHDFGQNLSFLPRIRVTGPAGSTVRLTPAEVVNPDGTIFRATMGSTDRGISWWQYTKATDGPEEWTPQFFYQGSRYLQADLLPAGHDTGPPGTAPAGERPRLESLEALVVQAAAASVGRFASGDRQLERIRRLVWWAQRSNFVSVLTDCPHREKLGWLEQYHLNGPAFRYEWDAARVFAKGVRDMAEAQTADGLVPNIAPEFTTFAGAFRAAAEWGASFIAVPWQQYQFLGDTDLLRTFYPAMKRYFVWLEGRARDGILTDGLGDWYDLGPRKPGRAQLTPPEVTATAHFQRNARLLAQIATVLGETEDAAAFAARAEAIAAAYRARFGEPVTGLFAPRSQTGLALPLALGLAEAPAREPLLAALVDDIRTRGWATTAGGVGHRYVLRALAEGGRSDVIHRMLHHDEQPGYAFQLKRGATSLTESWDANLGSSHNHFMLGHITEWFYRDLAGIDVAADGAGFRKLLLRPQPLDGVPRIES